MVRVGIGDMVYLFRRLHREDNTEVPDTLDLDSVDFNSLGITAFESTFRALFKQANSQAGRLQRITEVLNILERHLLTEEAIQELSIDERINLFNSLIGQSSNITRELIALSKPFGSLRVIIGTLDGLRKHREQQTNIEDALDT